tara:strand:+ start:2129 stop:2356 length:228 start_codon:yes stop_codon:yes gene_type:complete
MIEVCDIVVYNGRRGWFKRDLEAERGYGIVLEFRNSKKHGKFVAVVWWPQIQKTIETSTSMLIKVTEEENEKKFA